MSDTVISVENLSKTYRLGTISHRTLYRDIQSGWARLRGKEDPNMPVDGGRRKKLEAMADENGMIYALKDVSFEVKQGEVLGIIGKNGAGKSTLLKILSRVTTPTTGSVKIKGRIGSLLEVGTGFHPELTGRENIYMNGAILGMRKKEIDRKLDEIIDFSGVETFIDTPVKRYSSGMYVRLAFAVAAHLDPEILIVDEVLAVGDAEFQKKCLGKMGDISKKDGRTVLFVSHDMQAISTLTEQAVLLMKGKIVFLGKTDDAINCYLSYNFNNEMIYLSKSRNENPSITRVEILTSLSNNVHENGKELKILLNINMPRYEEGIAISIHIKDLKGRGILLLSVFDNEKQICRKLGENNLTLTIPRLKMYMGKYNISVHLAQMCNSIKYDTLIDICPFEVVLYKKKHGYGWQEEICTYLEDYFWQ